MPTEQNTPINGNTNPYSQNNTDVSSIVASIAMLSHDFKELGTIIKDLQQTNLNVNKSLITGLKDLQKTMASSNGKNSRSNNSDDVKDGEKKLIEQIKSEINKRKQLIKDLDKPTGGFKELNNKLDELNKSILADSKSLGGNFGAISKYSRDFSNTLQILTKEEERIRNEYANKLKDSAYRLNKNQQKYLEIQTKSLDNIDEADLNKLIAEEENLKRKIAQGEKEYKLLKEEYDEEVSALQSRKEFHTQEFGEMEKAIQERQKISSHSNTLLTESGKKFADRINRINDFFSPKGSNAYEEQYLVYSQVEDKIERTMAELDRLDEQADSNIGYYNNKVTEVTAELGEIAKELKNVKEGSSEEKDLKQQQATKQRERKEYETRLAEYKAVKENNKTKKALCAEEKRNNADFKRSIDNSFKWQTNIVNVIGKGIETLVNREIELYKQAANTVFDSLESTQKQLGKTLKMSTGEYDEFVDKLQAAAKEEGYAISSTQLLELASNLSDMGIRDENLIKSFAVSQAKATEAGVGSIFQMNEEFIKQYQRFYKETAATEGEEVAQEKLEKALGEWVAIEKKISDDYGSATALAQGGMTEIANYANELQKSNYLNQENSSMFMYGLANVAQAVEDNGGDFSLLLSDIKTITENPESELSASLLNAMETNREDFLQRLSEDPTQVISDYLTKLSDRYAGLDMTDLTYKMKAYGESMTPTQMKGLLNTTSSEISGVTKEGLDKAYNEISEGLSEGTYLTATEKLEKRNIQMAEDVAQIAQKVADGSYWMNNTLNAGQSLLTDFIAGFTNGLGRLLTGRLSEGGLLGSGSTGTLAKGGVGDFLVGGKTTKAGVLGSEIAGGAGIAYGEFTLLKDTIQGLSDGDGLLESVSEGFGDPEFSRGMGMALGGAIAGPIGAAVGGVVAEKAVPKLQEAFEDSLTAGLVSDSELAYKRQQEAADELKDSASKLTESANAQLEAVSAAREEAKSYSTMQKEDWLKAHENELRQSGLLTEELDFTDTESVKKAFDKYFNEYQDKVESGAKMELGRGELGEAISDNLAKYLSKTSVEIEGKTYTDAKDIMKALDAGEITTEQASAAKSELEEVSSEDKKQALEGLIRSLADQGEGELLLNQMSSEVEKVMSQEGYSGTTTDAVAKAWENLSKDLGYTAEQSAGMKAAYDELAERKERWKKDNEDFQAKFKNAMEKANSQDARDIREKYFELYPNAGKDLFSYVVMDPTAGDSGNNLYSYQETISEDKLPSLTTKRGGYTYETNGQWGEGYPDIPKFKTGIDYVPYDDFLALLHKGETVLNATEAQDYRDNTTISFDSINNTLVAQTDRIETILNKILTAVYSISSGTNSSSLNPNIINIVSGIATM